MSLDDIYKRRALRLKSQLTENGRPKPGFLSTIYPAMDYGDNSPSVLKTPSSIPGFNDAEGEPDFENEKEPESQDEPGPSKGASFSQPAIPGESSMVPDAHKQTAFELGYFGEERSKNFIKNCIEIITGVKKLENCDSGCDEDPTEGGDVDTPDDAHVDDDGHSKLSSAADKFSTDEVKSSDG